MKLPDELSTASSLERGQIPPSDAGLHGRAENSRRDTDRRYAKLEDASRTFRRGSDGRGEAGKPGSKASRSVAQSGRDEEYNRSSQSRSPDRCVLSALAGRQSLKSRRSSRDTGESEQARLEGLARQQSVEAGSKALQMGLGGVPGSFWGSATGPPAAQDDVSCILQ